MKIIIVQTLWGGCEENICVVGVPKGEEGEAKEYLKK